MRLNPIVIASATASVVLANPASAQRTGTLVPRGEGSSMVDNANVQSGIKKNAREARAPSRNEVDSARRMMRAFTSCILTAADTRREHDAVVAFLRTSPDETQVETRATKVVKSECLRSSGADYVQLRFDPSLLRGELFRQLYLDTQRTPVRTRIASKEIAVETTNASGSAAFYARMGKCVVAARPGEARAMVVSDIASVEEDAAVRALGPAIGACIEQGIKLQLGRGMLKGVLAEALYEQATGATLVTQAKIAK